jgi:hypothetical protein
MLAFMLVVIPIIVVVIIEYVLQDNREPTVKVSARKLGAISKFIDDRPTEKITMLFLPDSLPLIRN